MTERVWQEHEIVMISALEHYSYCPRQCALIYIEGVYEENIYTLRGSLFHQRVDEGEAETRSGVRIERSLPLWSDRLGLIGKADVVEFHGHIPFPVEYKVGPKVRWPHADIQLCAQAVCLEEMTGVPVPRGAVYYHGSRQRKDVKITEALKEKLCVIVQQVRALLLSGEVPEPANDARCRHCSLVDSCIPYVVADKVEIRSASDGLFDSEET